MHVMMYIRSCSTPVHVYTTVGIPAVFPSQWGIHVNAGLPILPSPMMATKGRDKDEKKKGRKVQKQPTSGDVHDSTPAKKNNSLLRRLSKKKSSDSGSSSQSLKALDGQPLPDCARRSPDLQGQNQALVSTSFTPASSDNVFSPDESASDLQGELFPDDPEKVSI